MGAMRSVPGDHDVSDKCPDCGDPRNTCLSWPERDVWTCGSYRYGRQHVRSERCHDQQVKKLESELSRYRTLCENHIGKTADGVFLCECEKFYCPQCGEPCEGDSVVAYCWNCDNPDDGGGIPLPLSWSSCTSKPMANPNWRNANK